MKKQVTFSESQRIHRLHQDEALPRSIGMDESKMAGDLNFNGGLKIHRPSATRCEPQLQHATATQIPKTSFLKHTALSPAQKEYLYTIAASSSTAHVRNLITQHYMNVLHRCKRAGYNAVRDDLVVSSSVTLPVTVDSDKRQSKAPSRAKHKEKINTSARTSGKSFLPKISNRRTRLSTTSASKQTKTKKRATTSPRLRRKSPIRGRIRQEDEEEEEEGLDDSLSECLSSLSMGDWDDDAFSDL